jgi:predicted dehydrogenase
MKILLFGLGSIGRRHAQLLLKEGHEVHAFRSGVGSKGNEWGLPEIYKWTSVDDLGPDAAIIANPTYCHIETALGCAERNIPMFIEKPVSNSWQNVERLLHRVKQNHIPTYVGYVLRFHTKVSELKGQLAGHVIRKARFVSQSFFPEWRSGKNHLELYAAQYDFGGGALLEVSHELDLVTYLLGPVRRISGKLERRGDVTVDTEDYVDVRVEAAGGIAEVVIDIASREPKRFISIETNGGIFEVDLLLKDELNISYVRQLQYFLANYKNPNMMNSLESATLLLRHLIDMRHRIAA